MKWQKEKLSYKRISKHLSIPRDSVRSIIRFYKKHGHSTIPQRVGRPRRTNARVDRRIVREVERDRIVSAAVVAAQVTKDIGKPVSSTLVRERVRGAGLHGRSARKKPFLSRRHRQLRAAYAKRFDNMASEWWSRMLFSDEASVELHGTSGRVSVWRRADEAFDQRCVVPTFKSSSKSLMVWSSITANGVGTLHFCEKSVTGDYYRRLLRHEIPFTKQFLGLSGETLFVHANAPAHTTKLTAGCLRELKLMSLGHPPQSPDLNPIENVWFVMKKKLHKNPATSIDDLKVKLSDIWANIDDDAVRKCVLSMPKRLKAVLASNGGQTKY
ncbi:hypothetical protein PR003_g10710 [Phytophthora rubi]|uniref:Tc1-like transposase DDE domain-containing protein n=1 Tax=Phytophthora rubi TaxID=129364 RepID=A0A6A3IPX8_9STRA|nr:hypothetical protein PR001_g23805 [Phytophthora rubi]KAE9340036.1 hypothetical protein PR003_g10710 [Phytophthora rubi]